MKLPNFLKRFWSKEKVDKNTQPENITNHTAQEIWNIIRSWNIQWENFNKVVDYIENIILWVLKSDVELLDLRCKIYTKNLRLALIMPLFIGEEYFNGQMDKADPELLDIFNKNQVTRVSTDSLRRYFILKSLDKILKIASVDDFWDGNYKIWDIEINSFEDLEKHREKLQDMYEEWENYNIPWYREAVEYAAQNGINTNFYL